jgi:hypothetical protein
VSSSTATWPGESAGRGTALVATGAVQSIEGSQVKSVITLASSCPKILAPMTNAQAMTPEKIADAAP